jgi:outer membrane protein assembly factor BamB
MATVLALQADTGAELWRASAGGPCRPAWAATAACQRGDARQRRSSPRWGREVWRKRVPASVVTPPLVAGERVFVMAWTAPCMPSTPSTAAACGPAASGRCADAGPAGCAGWPCATPAGGAGRALAGVDPTAGSVRGKCRWPRRAARTRSSAWPTWWARPCAWATGCARAPSSRPWAAPTPGQGQPAVVAQCGRRQRRGRRRLVFGADASDRIAAWRWPTATWPGAAKAALPRPERRAGRRPVVVFGDRRHVHFLSAADGEAQLRLPTDGSPSSGAGAGRQHHADRHHAQRRAVRLPAQLNGARP